AVSAPPATADSVCPRAILLAAATIACSPTAGGAPSGHLIAEARATTTNNSTSTPAMIRFRVFGSTRRA
ncbi:hypothetical protein ABZ646_15155, partial [Streptomyces sp. NPDC007162]